MNIGLVALQFLKKCSNQLEVTPISSTCLNYHAKKTLEDIYLTTVNASKIN